MAKAKSGFISYLEEFDGTGVGSAFSNNVLQHSQLTQDMQQGDSEEESKKEREAKLRKEIEDSLVDSTNNDDSIVKGDRDSKDQRILKHLKNLLFRMPGVNHADLHDEPHADFPSDNDHEVFYNDKQLVSNGSPVTQSGYGKFDDPNNPRKMPDATYTEPGADHEEDKHEQLLAAIGELRDELRKARGDGVEQEEDTEEDESDDTTQFSNAQKMFQTLVNQKMSRGKIISSFEKNLGVTNSTAVSYYQRLAKDAGLTNSGERQLAVEPPGLGMARGFEDPSVAVAGGQPTEALPQETNVTGVEVPNNPNRQGLIRTVSGAHLVYKRRNEEGTFDELWVFGTGNEMEETLKVRRNILAGTDIPPRATKSQNGAQSYTLKTLGNGQLLHIKGLPN